MGLTFGRVLIGSWYVYHINYLEFKKSIDQYTTAVNSQEYLENQGEHITLGLRGGIEIARRTHNYAAGWKSLVDHTRAIVNSLEENSSDDLRRFPTEYAERLKDSLRDSVENDFINDLRRMAQHKSLPVPRLYFIFDRDGAGWHFNFHPDDIRDFDWRASTRRFIEANSSIPIGKLIGNHYANMKEFYQWIDFRDRQLGPYANTNLDGVSFDEWKSSDSWNRAV